MRRRIASLLSQTADVELCTSAKSIFVPHYITSYFIYYATWQVAKEIKTEIEKLQNDTIPDDELRRLKSFMISDLARTLDTPFSIADYYASLHNNHISTDYFERQLATINSISASRLLDIAQRRLSSAEMLTVVAGNAKEL